MITVKALRTRETDYEFAVSMEDVVAAFSEVGVGMPVPGRHADESEGDYFERLVDLPGMTAVVNLLTERAVADTTLDEDPEVGDETTWTLTDWCEDDEE